MNRFINMSLAAILMTAATPVLSKAQISPKQPPPRTGTAVQQGTAPNAVAPPAIAPLLTPPTPGGPLPQTTFVPPFGAQPYSYYSQTPVLRASPYARYLESYQWNQPFHVTPLLNIPSYYDPPIYQWHYVGPVY
jgi:hypothetical protein